MRYKIMGAVGCIAVLLVSLLIPLGFEEEHQRVHQHLETVEKETCRDHDSESFCTHLPLVHIETGGVTIPGIESGETDFFGEQIYTTTENGEEMIESTVTVFDNQTENNHLGDKPVFSTKSLIRVRGHASRDFEKAPYLLKFVDEIGADNPLSVMGMDAHNEWVLNGPYLDKSLVRNYLWYNIAGEIMEYAPNVRYCELFVNGDYRGIYLMTESVSNGNDCRLNLTVTEKDETMYGYLLRLDRPTEEELTADRNINTLVERLNILGTDISLRYPGKNTLTAEFAEEAEMEFARFEKALYSYDYKSDEYGYANYIDVNNFVDYFLINEFAKNMDAGRYSTFIYKAPGEKYKLCVWDFNNCAENFPDDVTGYADFTVEEKTFFSMLMKDKEFVQKILDRYEELRKSYFSEDYINTYIDETLAYLGPAVERNNTRWATYIESNPLLPEERNVHSHQEAVTQLKMWLCQRGEWLDKNISTLRQYCADSKNKIYNSYTE